MNILKRLFGMGPATDYKELMKNGAIIIDVRSPQEFNSGAIKGSSNVPLDRLENSLERLKDKKQHIITCCASGMRSASAKAILRSKGYENVYNGGGWMSLNSKI